MACRHPKESRSLLSGYDVVCGECESIIGRVALFPCAVLSAADSQALLGYLPETLIPASAQKGVRALEQAVRA